jgi:hypothetical protein
MDITGILIREKENYNSEEKVTECELVYMMYEIISAHANEKEITKKIKECILRKGKDICIANFNIEFVVHAGTRNFDDLTQCDIIVKSARKFATMNNCVFINFSNTYNYNYCYNTQLIRCSNLIKLEFSTYNV